MAITLNPRERKLLGVLGIAFGAVVVVGMPIGLEFLVSDRKTANEELRAALSEVQDARGKMRERQSKKDAIAQRYANRAPALAGFIEQSARALKLEVTDSVDRPEVPHGKRYVERHTIVHLKKSGMYAIAKFLEGVEKSPHPVSVSRLNVRKRAGEPDSYDVEVGISAYDRSELKPSEGAKDTKDAKEGDKEKKP